MLIACRRGVDLWLTSLQEPTMKQRQSPTSLIASAVFAAASACAASAFAAPILFTDAGANAAAIQDGVDAFRAALGNPNNGNAPGPLPGGRREINWDGGGSDVTTAPVTPFTVFQNIRGATFTTPGTGLTQAPPSGGPQGGLATLFANATYGTIFTTFSAPRLFAPVGSNITDGTFSVPGTNGLVGATVTGFGAIFTDVDLADSTSIEFFGLTGASLGSFDVPVGGTADGSLSFLGVLFDAGERIARVRIINGTTALGPNDNPGGGVDVVAMDDFLYAEPQAISEPTILSLIGLALIGLGMLRRRRR
jgi:hypothetical protein